MTVDEELDLLEAAVKRLRGLVSSMEARQVITEFRPDYGLKLMMEIRLDNDEIVSTRPLTLIERNARLFGEGSE